MSDTMSGSKPRESFIFDGRYSVTDEGEVYSHYFKNKGTTVKRDPPLKMKQFMRNGYLSVCLSDRKSHTVHRLVARCFLGEPPSDKPLVLHNDSDRTNNKISNLRYGDLTENAIDSIKEGSFPFGSRCHLSKLNERDVMYIRMLLKKGIDQLTIAEIFRVSSSTISMISLGKTWKQLGEV